MKNTMQHVDDLWNEKTSAGKLTADEKQVMVTRLELRVLAQKIAADVTQDAAEKAVAGVLYRVLGLEHQSAMEGATRAVNPAATSPAILKALTQLQKAVQNIEE